MDTRPYRMTAYVVRFRDRSEKRFELVRYPQTYCSAATFARKHVAVRGGRALVFRVMADGSESVAIDF